MQIYEVFQEAILKGVKTAPAKRPVKYQPLSKSIVNRMSQALGGGPLYKDPFERPGDEEDDEPVAATAKAADATAAAPVAAPAPAPAPAPTTAPATSTAEPSQTQSTVGVKQINQLIPKIRSRDLNSIKKNIDTVLTKRQSKTGAGPASAPATNAMARMATQLTTKPVKTSTGGTMTQTPTGLVHTAKPAATPAATTAPVKKAAAKQPNWTGRKQKVSAPPPSGAPTADEYANLERRLQQAMAAQGQTT